MVVLSLSASLPTLPCFGNLLFSVICFFIYSDIYIYIYIEREREKGSEERVPFVRVCGTFLILQVFGVSCRGVL